MAETQTVQNFKCPELGTYHGGVAEAIIRFDVEGNPKAIICDNYSPAKGYCTQKLKDIQEEIRISHQELGQNYQKIKAEVKERYNVLKQRGQKVTEQQLEMVLNEALRSAKAQELSARLNSGEASCIVARGFQPLR
jgi:hypothetical protein